MIQREVNNRVIKVGLCSKLTRIFSVGLAFLFSVILALPLKGQAAEFYFEPFALEINLDQFILINFFVDTQGEDINALEGVIKLPDNLLEVQRVSDGNTIISFWAQRPVFDEDNNEVRFSGIIPGGFWGKDGFLFSINCFSREKGQGKIEIQEAKALLNDGKGTETKVFVSPLEILVSDQAVPFSIETKEDLEPPEAFIPELASDPDIFGGKWFLAFATQDKGSGIAYYEIYESIRKREVSKIGKNDWAVAISPYVLKDQNLRSYIYVKAVDNEGNQRVAIVEPRNPMKWYELWQIWFIIILLGIIVIYLAGRILWRRSQNIR